MSKPFSGQQPPAAPRSHHRSVPLPFSLFSSSLHRLHCSLGRTSPAKPKMSGPSPAQSKKNIFRKICDFPAYFLLNFGSYQLVFLYRKNTNPVLKYLVFVKTLKKYLCFHAYGQVSKSIKKKSYCIFIQQRKLQKKNILACILALITSLLKSRELGQCFKKIQNNYFLLF